MPLIVIVLDAKDAVTPEGNPVAVPIPVAPVVVCVMSVSAVLIHSVGDDDAALTVLFGVTTNTTAEEVPPPGAGLLTVILKLPAEEISVAVMEAVSCEADTKVVVLGEPLNNTSDETLKLDPLTVKGNPAPPEHTAVGDIVEIVGLGLLTLNGLLTPD